MAIRIEIIHPLPANREDSEPVMVYIYEGKSGSTESWIIALNGRVGKPVVDLLREQQVEFGFSPDGSRYHGVDSLPAIVIGSLARLPYTFRGSA